MPDAELSEVGREEKKKKVLTDLQKYVDIVRSRKCTDGRKKESSFEKCIKNIRTFGKTLHVEVTSASLAVAATQIGSS